MTHANGLLVSRSKLMFSLVIPGIGLLLFLLSQCSPFLQRESTKHAITKPNTRSLLQRANAAVGGASPVFVCMLLFKLVFKLLFKLVFKLVLLVLRCFSCC